MRLSVPARWLSGVAAVVLVAGALWAVLRAHPSAATGPAMARTSLPRKVTVEVLNSTRLPGIARVATVLLRHAGLDVVYYGNADSAVAGRRRTEVLVRRGDTTGVGRVIEALGQGDVVDAPDRSRMVDLTVLIGTAYLLARQRPPP